MVKPKKRKVLVIDDDRPLAQLFASHLREAGFVSLIGEDAMQGFMYAQRELPDLILLDVMMPAGGGMLVFDRLAKNAKTAGIPVVVITASTDPKVEADSTARGARAVLHKPIDKETLLKEVAGVLDSPP
ncbi:MAG TPA: response regulator [Gemmatimonadales bacterium]|jgi:DNA-binding response OmpR family regulator|nr:response regulator [Gemmatimonadales bacterium]